MRTVSRGRELAHAVVARVAPHAAVVEKQLGRQATLAIVAGADPASKRFVQIKERLLADVPLKIAPWWLTDGETTAQVVAHVAGLNTHAGVDAIFLQFPLPAQIDGQEVADAIVSHKDIDASGRVAEELFVQRRTPFRPVAPQAAYVLLQDALGTVAGSKIVVCGADNVFTRALRTLLQRGDARVQVAAPDAPGLHALLGEADALVVSDAPPSADAFANVDWLSVVLDAGYYLPPRPVDWLPANLTARTGVLLKQYGNVGPLTVALLARATVRAAARRFKATSSGSQLMS